MKQPCKQCPYRKDSAPGYLGEASGKPEVFLKQLELDNVHPCHIMVDWENGTVEDYVKAPVCTGALQFMNNSCKLHQNQVIQDQQRGAGKNDEVISFPHNFTKHHTIK